MWREGGRDLCKYYICRDDFRSGVEWPITEEEWQSFLQQQLATRSKETGQLKEALFNFIQTLDNVSMRCNIHFLGVVQSILSSSPLLDKVPALKRVNKTKSVG